eukprot:TRINITY_DN25256_c0_g2_i1.p4 TRINITY_DN25256_c0_g2~~TRINITY_DN25256_c0_g2_i1.p4  ORF type:complete len:200 (-),score=8.56 TRINITY_DN25256_c0_g2_i1:704-1234(-)
METAPPTAGTRGASAGGAGQAFPGSGGGQSPPTSRSGVSSGCCRRWGSCSTGVARTVGSGAAAGTPLIRSLLAVRTDSRHCVLKRCRALRRWAAGRGAAAAPADCVRAAVSAAAERAARRSAAAVSSWRCGSAGGTAGGGGEQSEAMGNKGSALGGNSVRGGGAGGGGGRSVPSTT